MLRHHLEIAARHSWETLRDANAFNISQGEETLTDNLLLYLLRQKLPRLRLLKTPKNKEAQMGTDWEWWIGSRTRGFLRYAVQAKKLDSTTHRYLKLRHEVRTPSGPEAQESILKRYATANSAIPLYALYNHLDLANFSPYWNCPKHLEQEQLGITVTPLRNIEHALATWGAKSFESLHSCLDTVPIRCLAVCPQIVPKSSGTGLVQVAKFQAPDAVLYTVNQMHALLASDGAELGEFPSNLYNAEIGIYPKRIAVIETEA